MKALVLGGSGFLGSYVVDALCGEGYQVTALDRQPERFRGKNEKVEFFQADFGNRGELDQILKRGIDFVFHLVSSTIPQTSNDDPIFDVQSNVVETIALLEMCVKYTVKRVVFVSSGGTVYGIPEVLPIPESHQTLPLCSYGVTKLAIEHYLHLFFVLHGLKYSVLRLSNPYGPRQDPRGRQGAVSVFMSRMLKGEEISVWGDGSVVRDYIHASDFASACIAVVQSDAVGVYNVGGGAGTSLNELIHALEYVTGKPARVRYLPGRGFDVPRLYLDCTKIEQDFGWKPKVEFSIGLAKMSDWMSAQIAASLF
ncbi:NAD-dependent epimerase/dehydratase family protein [Ferriphaselus sp. R-1]|uniref:NAD-dependent epimerase/dehydratase family protein n=1 Tax=Ferriphaselus sp. R-1 TaxID=1485544 RepID=UPI0009DD0A0F|nr:NAD-dependent epimerase/dehydratase family protein [Ferriphaselus sp. R-1]